MRQGTHTSIDEKVRILKSIVDTYAEGEYPVAEILKTVPISEATFASWLRTEDDRIKEIKETYKKTQHEITQDTIKQMIPRVVNNLQRLADGFEIEEEETIFGTKVKTDKDGKQTEIPYVKQKKVVKKRYPPNLGANIFIAKNASPELFKEAMEHKHSGSVEIPQGVNFDDLTPEQLAVLETIGKGSTEDE